MSASTRTHASWVDAAGQEGQRLDNFLFRVLSGVPRSRVYRMLRKGEVRVNGRRARGDYRLAANDRVRLPPVQLEARRDARPLPREIERSRAWVVRDEDDVLLIDKPAGVAVHGGSGIRFGVIELLRALYDDPRLELAHRIDRDTSGCLLVARGRQALTALHAGFRAGEIVKTYDVLVGGEWAGRHRSVVLRLKRYVLASGERRVRADLDGKPARTDFEVVARAPRATWLSARPATGRTHQIRVHAAASGHAVLGDDKYAGPAERLAAHAAGVERLCLHARALAFSMNGVKRRYEVEAPPDFVAAWQAMRAR